MNRVSASLSLISHLEVNEDLAVKVLAVKCCNAIGVRVEHIERYELAAGDKWIDKQCVCSAAGYASPNWLLTPFKRTRRVPNQPWFCLLAAVHPDPILESKNPCTENMVAALVAQTLTRVISKNDLNSQMIGIGQQGTIGIERDGYLYLFGNDVA